MKRQRSILKQQGVVLFFTLIALVAMSLAALALIRSVDTTTMIAGNLAFKQAATTASEPAIEAAMTWMINMQQASAGTNVLNDAAHVFNNDSAANGFYSSLDPALKLTDKSAASHLNWDDTDSKLVGIDSGGNETRYVIQRVCRRPNNVPGLSDCLYATVSKKTGSQAVQYPPDVCTGTCPREGETPQYVITVRTTGPRDTESYVQTFAN